MGLREARLAAGYSQGKLEKISGVSQAIISQIERGKTTNPRVDYAIALSSALGKTVEEVFGKNLIRRSAPPSPKGEGFEEIDRREAV